MPTFGSGWPVYLIRALHDQRRELGDDEVNAFQTRVFQLNDLLFHYGLKRQVGGEQACPAVGIMGFGVSMGVGAGGQSEGGAIESQSGSSEKKKEEGANGIVEHMFEKNKMQIKKGRGKNIAALRKKFSSVSFHFFYHRQYACSCSEMNRKDLLK